MAFLRQLLQQRLGFLEVGGVEALGEPAVDRREQVVRFLAFALLLPQAAQAHSGSQLPGFGLLAAGNLNRLLKVRFGFHLRLGMGGRGWGMGAWSLTRAMGHCRSVRTPLSR